MESLKATVVSPHLEAAITKGNNVLWCGTFQLAWNEACDLVFGAVRGIPFWWRLIDGSFGVFGFIPLWWCRKWTRELAQIAGTS